MYKYSTTTGSITANADNGLSVDAEGRIWWVIPYKAGTRVPGAYTRPLFGSTQALSVG